MKPPNALSPYQPQLGCLLVLLTLMFVFMMPFILLDAAQLALQKLHLSPTTALTVLMGILFGGLINLPVYMIERDPRHPVVQNYVYTVMGWVPLVDRQPQRTIIAVNVGGCLIPVGLAIFESRLVFANAPSATQPMLIAAMINTVACYLIARPIPGLGIAMPAFSSPLISVMVTWLLLPGDEFALIRAPVAFVAGVIGPLVGADLLHLRDVAKMGAPMMSIGGAGTFDGIVLSGLLAAFLA